MTGRLTVSTNDKRGSHRRRFGHHKLVSNQVNRREDSGPGIGIRQRGVCFEQKAGGVGGPGQDARVPGLADVQRGGVSRLSAGGVTLAQEAPTRTSSAIIAAGSAALRLNNTKLAIPLRSVPALLVKAAGGAAGQAEGGSRRVDPQLGDIVSRAAGVEGVAANQEDDVVRA